MIEYDVFNVPERYYDALLTQRKKEFIIDYFKTNGCYPSEDNINAIVLSEIDKDKMKHSLYCKYLISGEELDSSQNNNSNTNNSSILQIALQNEIERSKKTDSEHSASIAQLRRDVNNLSNMGGGDLASLVTMINSMQKEVNELQNDKLTLEERIEELETELNIIKNNSSSEDKDNNEPSVDIPNEKNMVDVMFKITMDDIPSSMGKGDFVNTIFKQGILNGDLLDLSIANLNITNENMTIVITNINETYSLPVGTYNVTGTIGRERDSKMNKGLQSACLNINEEITVHKNGEIYLNGIFEEVLIISDKEFIYRYYKLGSYSNGGGSFPYNGYYYVFGRNILTSPPDSYKLYFDGVTYTFPLNENGKHYIDGTYILL